MQKLMRLALAFVMILGLAAASAYVSKTAEEPVTTSFVDADGDVTTKTVYPDGSVKVIVASESGTTTAFQQGNVISYTRIAADGASNSWTVHLSD